MIIYTLPCTRGLGWIRGGPWVYGDEGGGEIYITGVQVGIQIIEFIQTPQSEIHSPWSVQNTF